MTDLLDEALAAHLGRSLYDTINQHLADGHRAEVERDGAYRERAHLLAWLAALHPAVVAPAPDVDEPGWQLLYLDASGWQLSWHIAPRDADLFAHVEHVPAEDPRAQWDGHTTEEKYARIGRLTALAGPGPEETDTTPAEDHDAGWKQDDDGRWSLTINGGILTVPRETTIAERARLAAEWPAPAGLHGPIDTAHRYCILCGNRVQPGHQCNPNTVMQRLVETRERAGQLAAALREVLAMLFPRRNEHGTVLGYEPPYPITPANVNRWRAVLDQTQEQPHV